MWTVGMTLGGRYRLDALLGTDPVTGVWAGTHVSTGRRVALRQLPSAPELSGPESVRIVNEIRAISALDHIHVAPTYEVVLGLADAPVMVSALLVGETLAELLAKTPMLSLQQTVSLLLPVVSAVGAAHARGIVHGRLSPSSVFICETGEPSKVVVLDFGMAKWMAALRPAPASVRGPLGAPRRSSDYAPPEEAVPGRILDHRADIWAIGVIAYECLSGMRPVDFVPPEQAFLEAAAALIPIERHVAGLPRPLADSIADLVVADPEHRAQNLIEFFNVLGALTGERSPSFGWPGSERRITGLTQGLPALVPAEPSAPVAPARPPKRLPSWRVLALAASAVAAAELVLLVALVIRLRQSEARWAVLTQAAVELAGSGAGADEPRSESMTLRAAPPAVVVDDFEGGGDAPTLAALQPWQAFTLDPAERALPLLRGPGARGEHALEVRFLMDGKGASGRSGAGASSQVRGGVLDLSRYVALTFTHRLAPLRAPGLECSSPDTFVAFVSCRSASAPAAQRLEIELPVSGAWSSATLNLGELRLPGGVVPDGSERVACLSAIDGLGFRVDEAAPKSSGCDGGTLAIDDVVLR